MGSRTAKTQRAKRIRELVPCLLAAFACSAPVEEAAVDATPTLRFETSVDPGGCLLEHVAVDPGTNQYQVDGISADGSMLAVGWERGEDERGTYLLDLATGERTEIPGFDSGAVFSPSGETLVNSIYVDGGKTDIAEYNRESGETTIIARHEDWDWLASYSSDGETILFNSYRTGSSDVYTYRRADGALKQWTDDPRYEAHAQFSPDDSRVLFHRRMDEGNYDLFVLEVATGAVSQLTDDETEEAYGSWSPDGRTIVFASDRSQKPGLTDLFLMDADGSEPRQLTDHPAKDSHPFFSPDGRYIYFNSDRDPSGIYRITLDADLECVEG